jgi:hypothetical protein
MRSIALLISSSLALVQIFEERGSLNAISEPIAKAVQKYRSIFGLPFQQIDCGLHIQVK